MEETVTLGESRIQLAVLDSSADERERTNDKGVPAGVNTLDFDIDDRLEKGEYRAVIISDQSVASRKLQLSALEA